MPPRDPAGYRENHPDELMDESLDEILQELLDENAEGNIPELVERLQKKAGENESIRPDGNWKRPDGEPANFHTETRAWWRRNEGSLDPVETDVRMLEHHEVDLAEQEGEARLMGIRFAQTVQEMLQDYRELDYQIDRDEARKFAQLAGGQALRAQEKIGHPITEPGRYGSWTAESRLEDLATHLSRNGGRSVDPEYVSDIFADLHRTIEYAGKLESLETKMGPGENGVMDQATQELVEWAIRNSEFDHWAEGAELGYTSQQAWDEICRLDLERGEVLEARWGRAQDPRAELPGHVLEWAQDTRRNERWIEDYRNVLQALDGGAVDLKELPDWAKTTAGALRKQDAAQLRESVDVRLDLILDRLED